MKVIKLLVCFFSVLYLIMLCFLGVSSYLPPTFGWLVNMFLMVPLWVFYLPVAFLFIMGMFVKGIGVLVVNSISFIIITFCIIKFNLPFFALSQNKEQDSNSSMVIPEGKSLEGLDNYEMLSISKVSKISRDKFENSDTIHETIDEYEISIHSNAIKIDIKPGMDQAYSLFPSDNWHLETYPIISFAYKIDEGMPLEMRVKTLYNDWIFLKESPLIYDGKWHEITIDVKAVVNETLPALKYLKEFQFYRHDNRENIQTFWIDNFKIGSREDFRRKSKKQIVRGK